MEKLPVHEVLEQMKELPGGELMDEKWLIKKFRFRSYLDGVSFVNKIAHLSEKENHHPFITIDYKLITIKLTSWNARGITALDIKLIREDDKLFELNK